MKRFYLIAMLLPLTVLASLRALAYDFEVDGLYYNIESTAERTASLTYKEKVKVNGYSAGYNDYSKEELVIPSSVEYMGQTLSVIGVDVQAFEYNTAIQKVIIPPTIQWLHQECFYGCTSLSEVIIEDSEIPLQFFMKGRTGYFYNCPIATLHVGRNITLPTNVTGAPFRWLEKLKNVSFSNKVTCIVAGMFEYCTSLESISLPTSCTEIQDDAFFGCSNLSSICNTFQITSIGADAFNECTSLTEFVCNNLIKCGYQAFKNCSSLSKVELGNSLTIIPAYAFDGCKSLSKFTIPNEVTKILDNAFQNCTSLEGITFPPNISLIEDDAFIGCSSLKSLKIEYSEEPLYLSNRFLWKYDEYGNIGIVEFLEINRDIKSYRYQFTRLNFTDVKNIVIGPNVSYIHSIFDLTKSSGLQTILIYAETPPETYWDFYNNLLTTVKVLVPQGTKEAYQNHHSWKGFWNIEEYGESSGIESAAVTTEKTVSGKYDIYGRPVDDNYIGLVIIQYSDGTTEKVINR